MTEYTSPRKVVRPSRFIIVVFLIGASVFLYLRTFLLPATPFVVTDDQTLFFARAVRIIHGQILYRDFFELVSPGTDLLYAAAFRLFGIHAWVIQAWSICAGVTLSGVITLIASRIFSGLLVLLPALLFLVFDFSSALDMTHHWYSTLAAMAAVAVLIGGRTLQRIFVASLLCGVATVFTQTQGTLTFIALLAYLLWIKRSEQQEISNVQRFLALALPFILITSCVFGYYIYKAGFHTVFFDLVTFAPRFMSTIEINQPRTYLDQIRTYFVSIRSAHTLTDIISLIPVVFIYVLVPYVYFIGLSQLWRQRKVLPDTVQQPLVLLHLVGLSLVLAVANGPRFFRLCTVAPPAILVCVWLISQQGPVRRFGRQLLWFLAIVFAVLLPIRRQSQWHATLSLPIGQVAFNDVQTYSEFRWFAERTKPSDVFFNDSALSLYLSLNNPTPYEFVTYDEFTQPDQVANIVLRLQHHTPTFILLLPETTISSSVHDHAVSFRHFVHENYHLVQHFYGHNFQYEQELWELNSDSDQQSR
jgi:hypothetical protein